MRDGVTRAGFFGDIFGRLELVDRFDSDLAHDRHQHQVAFEFRPAVSDRLGGEKPGRHRAFAVAYAVADQRVALAPAGVKDRIGRAPAGPPLVLMDGGVEMTVETETAAMAGAGQRRDDIRS